MPTKKLHPGAHAPKLQLPEWPETKPGEACSKAQASSLQWGLMGHVASKLEVGIETQAHYGTVKLLPLQPHDRKRARNKGPLPAVPLKTGAWSEGNAQCTGLPELRGGEKESSGEGMSLELRESH